MNSILDTLFATIESRKVEMPNDSYTVELLRAGQNKICQKIGEEAVEVVVAALGEGDRPRAVRNGRYVLP